MSNEEYFEGHELRIEVKNTQMESYTSGETGSTIYCSIHNQSNKRIKVKVESSYIINSKSEQREMDYTFTGYELEEKTIEAGTYRTRGEIYISNKAGNPSNGWLYGITVIDMTNSRKYEACFKLVDWKTKTWEIVSLEIADVEKIKSPKMVARELKRKVERIEPFEEQLGITIQNISFKVNLEYNGVELFFDVLSSAGAKIENNIGVTCTIHDEEGDILDNYSCYIDKGNFMGLESFSAYFNIAADEIETIRIYAKKAF